VSEQVLVKENSTPVREQVRVSGVAIKAGVSRNRIKYTNEELAKFAPTLTGRPILKDHNATVDSAVGLVEQAMSYDNGLTVSYCAVCCLV